MKISEYPSPPFNVTVNTDVIIAEVKFLELTVFWDFEIGLHIHCFIS